MSTSENGYGSDIQRRLSEARERYNQLRDRKIRAQTEEERAQQELEEAEAEAKRLFGTSDLDELQKELKKRRDENARRVEEFDQSLSAAQERLQALSEEQAQ